MSGIVGIVNLDGAPVEQDLLWRMTEHMSYRGPDAQEIWIDHHVGFGHTMLRTTFESEAEKQPLSLDGEVWLTADARIDGRADLIHELESKSRSNLKGANDAELILHAYHAWGEDCVKHLIGDFAFAIWHGRRQRLFCARDHFGVKPFYYAQVANCLIFSNTLNSVRMHPAVSDELNDLAIADFLLFGFNQERTTTSFADIQRLPPAHSLEWLLGPLGVKRYWRLPVDGHIRHKRASDYIDHFRDLLDTSVEDRLRTSHVAVAMSGGLDSTTVAATAKEMLSKPGKPFDLRAFTIVYDRLIPDQERYYSGLVGKALGIPIHYLVADDYALYERWGQAELRYPEPTDFPLSAFVSDHLMQIATHSRLMLSGDGGDPVLLFSHSYFVKQIESLRFGPILSCIGRHVWRYGRLPRLGFRTTLRHWLGKRSNYQSTYPTWLNASFAVRLDLRARFEQLDREPEPIHHTRPEAYNYLVPVYWPDSFERADPGVTRIPVEARYPFFDLRLVNYLLAIPPIPLLVHKEVLRVAMSGLLPDAILRRPKVPLAGDPFALLLRQSSANWANHFAPTPELARFVDRDAIPQVTEAGDSSELWLNIRPLSLNYWLQYFRTVKPSTNPEVRYENTR